MSEAEEAFVRCCGTQRLSPRYYTTNGESEDEGSYANYDDSDTEQNMQEYAAMEGLTSSEDESDFANHPNVGTTIQDEDEKMDDYSSENDGEKEDESVKDQGERISDIHMTQNYIGGERQNFDNNPQLPPIQLSPSSPSTSSISAATISSSPSPTHLPNAAFRLYTPPNLNRDTLSTREPISLPPISNSYISDNYPQNQSSGSMLRYPPIGTNNLSYPPVPNSSFSGSSQTPQPVEPPKQSPLRYGFPDAQDDDEEAGSSPGASYDNPSRKRVRTKSNDWAQIGNGNNLNNNSNGTQQGYQPAHGTPSSIGRDQNSGSSTSTSSSSSSSSNNSSSNTIDFSNRSSRPMQPTIQLRFNPSSNISRYANITPDSSPITNFNTNYPRGPDFIPFTPQLTTMTPPPTNPISSSSSSSPTSTFSSPFMLPRPDPYRRQHVSNQVDSSPRRSSNHTSNGSNNNNNNNNNSNEQQSHNRNFTSENENMRREFVYSQDMLQERIRHPISHRWNNSRGGSEWSRPPPTVRRLGRSSSNNNTNNHSAYMNSLHESTIQGFLSDEEREPIEVPDSPQRELNNQSTNSNRDSQWPRRMTHEIRQQEFERERFSVNYIRPHALPQAATGTTAEGTTAPAPRHHHYHHHHHHHSNERAMTDAELARRMQAQEYSAIQSQNVRENVNSLARIISENGSIPRPPGSRHTSRRDTGSNSSSSARSNSTSRERLRFQSRLAELFDYHRHSDERSSERNRVGLRGSQSRPSRPHHHHFIHNHPLLSNFMEEIELEDLLEMLPDVIGNGIMSNPDNYLDDDEFDSSYENLIRLCEQNGDVKPKCAPEGVVDGLPTKLYASGKGKSVEERCTICLTEYETNDQLRVLPCTHEFHKECIDAWFKNSDQCAICRRSITDTTNITGITENDKCEKHEKC